MSLIVGYVLGVLSTFFAAMVFEATNNPFVSMAALGSTILFAMIMALQVA